MKLKAKLPPNRTYEQVLNHYTVEKAIAQRLKRADREERKKIYATMYDELFKNVPDHPRLIERDTNKNRRPSQDKTFRIVRNFITSNSVFLEFAPGDCSFARFMCGYVKQVYAVDIAEQRGSNSETPSNFNLIIYNGYDLDLPPEETDTIFSDQFIEHLHSEDVQYHLQLANTLLKQGGTYIFKTPHAFFGPWDVSLFFSDTAEGFHLKEWTFTELERVVKASGFSSCVGYWRMIKNYAPVPLIYFKAVESVIGMFPHTMKKLISRYFIPRHIVMICKK